ncbi:asparagine synthase-related protein [Caulobacter hibisci]|uniref:asparagine synthase-related protein n=1 Tax=Caulobacter hibisci TaxID=2035993 RepID=UPI001E61E3F9|nr:asparagine synthase-related protein [Caulobacter hibisci]
MRDYVLLTWRAADGDASARAQRAAAELTASQWTLAHDRPGLALWLPNRRPPKVHLSADGRLVLIGDYFGRPPQAAAQPLAAARHLIDGGWGGYIAVFTSPEQPAQAILRDPSGAMDALTWRAEGLRVIASDYGSALRAVAPVQLSVDWNLLGASLVERLHLAGQTPLIGVTAVTPGAFRSLDAAGGERLLWRPSVFVRTGADAPEHAPQTLASAIDGVVTALASAEGPAIAEISGGLDSSIVAAALQRTNPAKIKAWINYYVEDDGGDERAYARAAAAHLDLSLTEVPKPQAGVDLAGLAQAGASARPSFRLVDADYDRDLATRCAQVGADQIFTGLGGDSVFMQGGSPRLAGDLFRGQPPWRWRLSTLHTVAANAKTSIWRVIRLGLLDAARVRQARPAPPAWLGERALAAHRAQAAPLWLDDAHRCSFTKRSQVEGLARTLLVTGRSARSDHATVVNPLLSQPVMEAGLATPSLILTANGDDRAFARAAFADRLAPKVRDRRSKGDLSRHYGLALAQSAPQLRELLLDGALAKAGLLRLDAVEAMLAPEHLIWSDPYRDIIAMVVLELWARAWIERLAGRGGSAERRAKKA